MELSTPTGMSYGPDSRNTPSATEGMITWYWRVLTTASTLLPVRAGLRIGVIVTVDVKVPASGYWRVGGPAILRVVFTLDPGVNCE